jgi:hypothetical protein
MVGQTVLVHTGSSGSPTPVPNRTVQVQAVHGGSATCAGGTETLVYQSVTTGSDGKFTIALPYGTWTLSVSATTPIATSTRTSATVTIRPGQATSQANVRVWS